jgi:hypothetical protein
MFGAPITSPLDPSHGRPADGADPRDIGPSRLVIDSKIFTVRCPCYPIWPGHGRDISKSPISQAIEMMQKYRLTGLEVAALVGNGNDLHPGHVF